MKLFIANQNYSSWSLRAWLIFSQFKLDVEVTKLKLFTEDFYKTLEDITPTAKVPVLMDGDATVWDSLAILEYVNEQYLQGRAWYQATLQKELKHAPSLQKCIRVSLI